MLSQLDLHFLESLEDVDPARVTVSEAMSTDTYAIGPRSALCKVAAEMADHRYGSAVVVDRGWHLVAANRSIARTTHSP